jgi:RsiW-degrading membrane proteinase PrsW (M82 family)
MSERISDVSAKIGWGRLTAANLYFFLFVAVYGCLVLAFIQRTGPALLFPAYFLLAILVVTSLNRTISLGWVLMFFIYGTTAVPFVSLILTWPIDLVFDTDSIFGGAILVPVLEEILKVAPLVLLLFRKQWRFRWTLGAIDLMVLGAAIGAGFTFFEDTLLGFASTGFLRAGAGEYIMRSHEATPHFGPIYLFPSMDVGTANTAFIGHAAATAFVGLAIGLARLLGLRLRKGGWVLPAAALLWVTVDHAMFNYVAHVGRMSGLSKVYYTLNANGRLSSAVFYLLLAGALIYERWILQRNSQRTRHFRLDRGNLKLLKGGFGTAIESVAAVNDLRTYLQQRRALTYGLHLHDSSEPATVEQDRKRREYLEVVAFALAHWKSDVEITPSLVLDER